MIYVFDTGPLIHMFNSYYPEQFPTLWENFETLRAEGRLVSVGEVRRELLNYGGEDAAIAWARQNGDFFHSPNVDEMNAVRDVFGVAHFRGLVRKQARLAGKPVADPFVVAKARCADDGCVVTMEDKKPNAPNIPNVCGHFQVKCTNLQGFMAMEGWSF